MRLSCVNKYYLLTYLLILVANAASLVSIAHTCRRHAVSSIKLSDDNSTTWHVSLSLHVSYSAVWSEIRQFSRWHRPLPARNTVQLEPGKLYCWARLSHTDPGLVWCTLVTSHDNSALSRPVTVHYCRVTLQECSGLRRMSQHSSQTTCVVLELWPKAAYAV